MFADAPFNPIIAAKQMTVRDRPAPIISPLVKKVRGLISFGDWRLVCGSAINLAPQFWQKLLFPSTGAPQFEQYSM